MGAPQTIDQRHLYGTSVRWYWEPGVADDAAAGSWRGDAARTVVERADGKRRFIEIRGSAISGQEAVAGCPFPSRCDRADARCVAEMPEMTMTDGDHGFACWNPVEENR